MIVDILTNMDFRMNRLLKLVILISLLFYSSYSFSDHQLKKNNKQAIAVHEYRLGKLKRSFKNEIISKSSNPIQFKDISKPNNKIKKIISNSDLLSVLYFNGNEIEINEISQNKMNEWVTQFVIIILNLLMIKYSCI